MRHRYGDMTNHETSIWPYERGESQQIWAFTNINLLTSFWVAWIQVVNPQNWRFSSDIFGYWHGFRLWIRRLSLFERQIWVLTWTHLVSLLSHFERQQILLNVRYWTSTPFCARCYSYIVTTYIYIIENLRGGIVPQPVTKSSRFPSDDCRNLAISIVTFRNCHHTSTMCLFTTTSMPIPLSQLELDCPNRNWSLTLWTLKSPERTSSEELGLGVDIGTLTLKKSWLSPLGLSLWRVRKELLIN